MAIQERDAYITRLQAENDEARPPLHVNTMSHTPLQLRALLQDACSQLDGALTHDSARIYQAAVDKVTSSCPCCWRIT